MVSEVDKLVAELRFMDVILPDIYERIQVQNGHIISINFDSTHLARFPHFPISIARLPELKQLSLRYNHLKTIPDPIFQLPNLESLDLGHNHINIIPSNIIELTELKELRLNNNNIEHFDYFPCNLYRLNLTSNRVTCPQIDCSKISLTSLSLANNQIEDVTDFTIGSSLQFLNLRSNRITTFPSSLANSNLKKLNLYNNPLDISTFPAKTSIETVFIDHHVEISSSPYKVLYPRFKDYRFDTSHPPEFGVSYQGVPFTSIMIYGSSEVGKQRLIETFLSKRFIPDTSLTISQNRYLNWDHYLFEYKGVYYQVWYPFSQDLSDPTFRTSVLNGFYYTSAVILLFSYDDVESFKTVIQSIQQIYEIRQSNCQILVVGSGKSTQNLDHDRVRSYLNRLENIHRISIPLIDLTDNPRTIDLVFEHMFVAFET